MEGSGQPLLPRDLIDQMRAGAATDPKLAAALALFEAREEYERRIRFQRRPEQRVKIVGKRAAAAAYNELTSDQRAWVDRAHAVVRRTGHRRGGAREVLIQLFAQQECALTVQEIGEQLTARLESGASERPVGIASIYRGVDVLQDLDLIARVDVGDGVARYERTSLEHSDQHHHHHFVCDKCGVLQPFDDEALEEAIEGLESRLGFVTKGHEVTLRGTCIGCQ
jgi:Fur family transcriptional regulator, ferric uptake regulator